MNTLQIRMNDAFRMQIYEAFSNITYLVDLWLRLQLGAR